MVSFINLGNTGKGALLREGVLIHCSFRDLFSKAYPKPTDNELNFPSIVLLKAK